MVTNNSITHIALAVKATLDGFPITQLSQLPTIRNVKTLTMELCNMATAVKSTKSGGKFSHMYLILKEDKYQIATCIPMAMVTQHTKPDDVNPKFKTEKKEDLSSFCIRQLEAKMRAALITYTTQEEIAKEIIHSLVDSNHKMYVKEIKNKFTRFTNQTPKSILAHLAQEYCEATITNKLLVAAKFKIPWD